MMTAARLGMLGVTALVIEKNARTGDVWRERYHDLVLHDPCYMNAMPYLPYPPSWPVSFLAKFSTRPRLMDLL
jgi:putative flavoprotein involved in K+ transport